MSRQMMGLETEFGLSAAWPEGGSEQRTRAIDSLFGLIRNNYPYLTGSGTLDLFTVFGRFYREIGDHLEHCTPECDNPWDVVRYTLAGRKVLADLIRAMAARSVRITLLTSNVDYLTHATWGCHESYLYRSAPEHVRTQIIPHLVSRIIYTGAGGFDTRSAGLRFMLSPRVAHLAKAVSSDSTSNRAIVHTKDESLSNGQFHRLHLICGESLSSHVAAWLKAGTTALVVAMIDSGLNPGEKVELAEPLQAMRTFTRDPSCTETVKLADGGTITAAQLQRHYLETAEAHPTAWYMPPWAPEVCRRWRDMLDRIEDGGGDAVATMTDWGIKRALYTDLADRVAGIAPEAISHWSHITERLQIALRDTPDSSVSVERILGADSPVASTVAALRPYAARKGLSLEGLRQFVDLRTQTQAIDSRFGMVGPEGLFSQLDAAGVLDHRTDGVDNIAHAVRHPPAAGRAHVRGQCIRRLTGQASRYLCTWYAINDVVDERKLDLSNPFVSGEHWVDLRPKPRVPASGVEVA